MVPQSNNTGESVVDKQNLFNDLSFEMNYHRQMMHALKNGKNFNECSSEIQKLINEQITKRTAINARIIELQNDYNIVTVPKYAVSSLLNQVETVQSDPKLELVVNPISALSLGETITAISNITIDTGKVTGITSNSIFIDSISRGKIELWYERSLFYKLKEGKQ